MNDPASGTLVPKVAPVAAARKRSEPVVAARPQQQASREGKVQLKAWVEPSLRKRLKALAVELDTPMEALMIEQLETLLKKHGK
jgi:hypothetical protein